MTLRGRRCGGPFRMHAPPGDGRPRGSPRGRPGVAPTAVASGSALRWLANEEIIRNIENLATYYWHPPHQIGIEVR